MKKLQFLFSIFLMCIFFNANGQATDVGFVGTASFSSNSKSITLEVGKIKNYQERGESGTLKLELYLTKEKYSGGTMQGYKVAEKTLDTLEPGQKYGKFKFSSTWLVVPPKGDYHVTLCLLEYGDDGEYGIVDHLDFQEKKTIDFY